LGEKQIRVLIANPTRFLRDSLYEALRQQPGFEVVEDVSEEAAIVPATERTDPDCLIVPLDDPSAPTLIYTEMLAKRPNMRIVAIGEGTNMVAVYWRCQAGDVRCTYTTASRQNILRALRFSTS